jgi:hypothetical protein
MHRHKWKEMIDMYPKHPMENHKDQHSTKCPIQLKDNSIASLTLQTHICKASKKS